MKEESRFVDQFGDTILEEAPDNASLYKVDIADRKFDYDMYMYSDYFYYNSDYFYYNDSFINDSYPQFKHTIFFYQGFDFERPIYTFMWEILVIFTTLFNIVVIVVFLRKRMRSVIHTVLIAIAISDSMTGLVTLPTYIYTYSHHEPTTKIGEATYVLDKYWCNSFMISKFFLSKYFHNVSIWLTLFLGAQRFVSVLYPLKTQRMFTMKNTFPFITSILVLSPFLHIYHLIHMKADVRLRQCHWILEDDWAFVQLWATLLLMHLIPSILLVILTALMIFRLFSALSQVRSEGWNASMVDRRLEWNRRMSIIVSTIVIAFLIPEVPYAIFLLITLIHIHSGKQIMPLKVNRAFHAGYEILLVLSFHANFWIYTVLNRRFRSELKKTAAEIQNYVLRLSGRSLEDISIASTALTGRKTKESSVSGRTGVKLEELGASNTSDSKNENNLLKSSNPEQAEKDEKV